MKEEYERYKNVLGVYEHILTTKPRITVENYSYSHIARRKKPKRHFLWVDTNINPNHRLPRIVAQMGWIKCFNRIEEFYAFLDRDYTSREKFVLIFANNVASHILKLEKKPKNRYFPYTNVGLMVLFCGDENRAK